MQTTHDMITETTLEILSLSTHTHTHTHPHPLTPSPPHTAPSAPLNLVVTGPGATALNISWLAPTDDGGRPVDRYLLEIRATAQVQFSNLTTVTDTFHFQRMQSVFVLVENTTYEYVVRRPVLLGGRGGGGEGRGGGGGGREGGGGGFYDGFLLFRVRVSAVNEAGAGDTVMEFGTTQSIGELCA